MTGHGDRGGAGNAGNANASVQAGPGFGVDKEPLSEAVRDDGASGRSLLRIAKALLAASVAAWAAIGAVSNVLDWTGTTASVLSVTAMTTFPHGGDSWRATANPGIVLAGAAYIVAFKLLVSALCAIGAHRMWRHRTGSRKSFAAAKLFALCGCALAVFFLFTGWVVIGEGWFQFWRSAAMRDAAGETVFRYGGFIALTGLLIGAREE